MPIFGQLNRSLFLIDYKVTVFGFFTAARRELGDELIDLAIKLGAIFSCAGDDQRRTGFINENRVHFINNGKGQLPLHLVRLAEGHIVAKVIKAELIVCAIDDIRRVSGTLFFLRLACLNHTDLKAKEIVKLAHPCRIARREVIVNGNQVNGVTR